MQFSKSCFALLLTSLLASETVQASSVFQLTAENFESATEGKSVFIKFYAPWCGHCRAMAEDYEKLAADWEGHSVGLVAEVDCTSDEGKPVCEDFEVQGFPTLVYGDPMSAETYEGARDYEAMSAFAKEHISTPVCSIWKIDNCSAEDKSIIEGIAKKTDEELLATAAKVEELVKIQEDLFDDKVAEIQKTYDALVENFNVELDKIKDDFHYKYLEQAMLIREISAEGGEEYDDESHNGEL